MDQSRYLVPQRPCAVFFVRHAQSRGNARSFDGLEEATDTSLTPFGEQQAAHLAGFVDTWGITHAVSSDLRRAVQTLELVRPGLGSAKILPPSPLL